MVNHGFGNMTLEELANGTDIIGQYSLDTQGVLMEELTYPNIGQYELTVKMNGSTELSIFRDRTGEVLPVQPGGWRIVGPTTSSNNTTLLSSVWNMSRT